MKAKDLKYLLAVAAALLCACSKNEQAGVPQHLICYDVVQLRGTKAAETYPTNRPFISYAFMLPGGKTWADNKAEAQTYIAGATVSYNGGLWYDQSQAYYWPSAGSLSFFSYSPEALRNSTTVDKTNGVTISGWDVNANQTVDIMVADVIMDQTAKSSVGVYTGVPTVFRHKLSQLVKFEFNTLQDYSSTTKFYVTGISLNNIKQKGTYVSGAEVGTTSVKMGKWTRDDTATPSRYYYYDGGTGGTETEIVYNSSSYTQVGSGSIMLLPQSFSDPGENPDWNTTPHLSIDYKVGSEPKTAQVSLYELFSGELGMNKQITIRVTFNNEGNLIMWAPDQEDWSDSEFTVIM